MPSCFVCVCVYSACDVCMCSVVCNVCGVCMCSVVCVCVHVRSACM